MEYPITFNLDDKEILDSIIELVQGTPNTDTLTMCIVDNTHVKNNNFKSKFEFYVDHYQTHNRCVTLKGRLSIENNSEWSKSPDNTEEIYPASVKICENIRLTIPVINHLKNINQELETEDLLFEGRFTKD